MLRSTQNIALRRYYLLDYRAFAVLIVLVLHYLYPTGIAAFVPSDMPPPEPSESASEKASKAELQKKIAGFIDQLGDTDYFIRQKAQEELSHLGFEAFEQLTAASTNDDLEIATRAKYLLKLMRVEWSAASDPTEVKRLLKGYEMLDADARDERIQALAALPDGQATAALCRLARYEKSNILSKRAAMELMQSTPNGDPPATQRANLIRKNIERGSRPAVQWIKAWLHLARDSQTAMDEFKRLSDAESQILQQTPDETTPDLTFSFIKFYIKQLKRLGQNDLALSAMRRLIELQKDDAATIADLAEWFLDQKAWPALEELHNRFAERFAVEPIPLYIYAEAKLAQNDEAKAKELAAQALKLNPGADFLPQHYIVARKYLAKRGSIAWAIKEYEYIISQAGGQDQFAFEAVQELAQIYYDQGQNLEAGQTIDKFLKKPSFWNFFSSRRARSDPFSDDDENRSIKRLRAEMYYYYGLHWESREDRKQQRANMEKAIEEDPTEIDALIGYYRLPDLTPEEKKKAVQLIHKSAEETRESIRGDQKLADDPRENLLSNTKEAKDCNQFAWLVANTEGNLDEALKYARRAVELQPADGSILDTLAHVYYAKGDYENAVKTEAKAAELDPHSGLIKKKLAEFQKAMKENNNEK